MSDSISPRIDRVFLPVQNINKAAQWYQEKLGWLLTRAVASIKVGEITLHTADLQKAYEGLKNSGVEVSELRDYGGFYIKDLDGNRIAISSR
jgi:catechol-2,3-dioxygenase